MALLGLLDFTKFIGLNTSILIRHYLPAIVFHITGPHSVYMGTDAHPHTLLPGLTNRLLAGGLPDNLRHKLAKLADEGGSF